MPLSEPTPAFRRFLGRSAIGAGLAFLLIAAAEVPAELLEDQQVAAPATRAPVETPRWNGIYAKAFPGCVGHGSFIPARIVVVPREGDARTMPYDEASVARITATWSNEDPADDLYTVGRCAR